MGIWPWQCTPTGLDNSTELRMEKIQQAVTEIWVPQVWQPPARPLLTHWSYVPFAPSHRYVWITLQPRVWLTGRKLRISPVTYPSIFHQFCYHDDTISLGFPDKSPHIHYRSCLRSYNKQWWGHGVAANALYLTDPLQWYTIGHQWIPLPKGSLMWKLHVFAKNC